MWNQGIQYDLLELLGEGAQGRVFKALRKDRQTGLSETVALKILHSETAVDLWKREFESLRRVRSPYCVQVLSFDRVQRRPALVLEYVEGLPLTHIGRSCILKNEDIVEVIAQIEAALKDLNRFGVFHGDLSPANIMIDTNGCVKLFDFGLANTGGPHARLTPEFASPERLAGEAPDLASDIFSLGRIESFLRGIPLPDQYSFNAKTPHPSAQRRLAKKVHLLMHRQKWASRFRTKTQQLLEKPVSSTRTLVMALLLGAFTLTASSAAPIRAPHSSTMANVSVRTEKWHKISVNGEELGFAPLNFSIPADKSVRIEWKSARDQGSRLIKLKGGQSITLEDRDFSH